MKKGSKVLVRTKVLKAKIDKSPTISMHALANDMYVVKMTIKASVNDLGLESYMHRLHLLLLETARTG